MVWPVHHLMVQDGRVLSSCTDECPGEAEGVCRVLIQVNLASLVAGRTASCLVCFNSANTSFFPARHPFPKVFSWCNRRELDRYLQSGGGMCLSNMPDTRTLYGGRRCGNGYLEDGEECDCGEEEVSVRATLEGGTSHRKDKVTDDLVASISYP